jgi:hypothetical protein
MLLGLNDSTASEEDIERAFRTAVKANHPDIVRGKEAKAFATERFKAINEAHDYLRTHPEAPTGSVWSKGYNPAADVVDSDSSTWWDDNVGTYDYGPKHSREKSVPPEVTRLRIRFEKAQRGFRNAGIVALVSAITCAVACVAVIVGLPYAPALLADPIRDLPVFQLVALVWGLLGLPVGLVTLGNLRSAEKAVFVSVVGVLLFVFLEVALSNFFIKAYLYPAFPDEGLAYVNLLFWPVLAICAIVEGARKASAEGKLDDMGYDVA